MRETSHWHQIQDIIRRETKENARGKTKKESSIRDSPRRMHHPRPRFVIGSAAESLSCLSSYASYARTDLLPQKLGRDRSDSNSKQKKQFSKHRPDPDPFSPRPRDKTVQTGIASEIPLDECIIRGPGLSRGRCRVPVLLIIICYFLFVHAAKYSGQNLMQSKNKHDAREESENEHRRFP